MEVRVLGLLEAVEAGAPVGLPPTKVRVVLTVLALHPNQVVPTDQLVEAIWGDEAPEKAANTLQVYVSQLRKVLPANRVVTQSPGYRLAIDPEDVDAFRFERMLDGGRRALAGAEPARARAVLAEALSLWRGAPLADFTYQAFAQAEIGRLAELRLSALEERLEADLALGRHAEVADELGARAREHPLRERFWGQLMVALYRCGRQAEALRAFSELRTALAEELGIAPSLPLQHLEEAVLLQRPELDWTADEGAQPDVPTNLPAQLTTFIGRDADVAEVGRLLDHDRLVTLAGTGGIGKTRLALCVAEASVARHPDGVYFVELAPVSDPSYLAPTVLAAAGVVEDPTLHPTDTLVRALSRRRVLLVLANCEHLIAACAALADRLLRACPRLWLLATSREPLRVAGEVCWRVPSLAFPPPGEPGGTHDWPAVRLFVERAQAADPRFALGPDNADAVARVCRRLDGVPLALELAAARVSLLSTEEVADRLDDRFQLLTGGCGRPRPATRRWKRPSRGPTTTCFPPSSRSSTGSRSSPAAARWRRPRTCAGARASNPPGSSKGWPRWSTSPWSSRAVIAARPVSACLRRCASTVRASSRPVPAKAPASGLATWNGSRAWWNGPSPSSTVLLKRRGWTGWSTSTTTSEPRSPGPRRARRPKPAPSWACA